MLVIGSDILRNRGNTNRTYQYVVFIIFLSNNCLVDALIVMYGGGIYSGPGAVKGAGLLKVDLFNSSGTFRATISQGQ